MKQLLKNKKTLIYIAVVAVLVLGYFLFFSADEETPPAGLVYESRVSEADIILGQRLLTLLAELKAISIDPEFFDSTLFDTLKDYSVPIDEQPVGRRNPFAPLGGASQSSTEENESESSFEIEAEIGPEI
ncbi:MAG: hypothetical protein COV70_03925 [Parcubacteria group bacterium CG11_big_fil_rev_8_21_14_0_20_39_22]|nr:MAG: hypothetical protein COV70_03925 [Parcubacteria group bacterium CG11_big_fil_rev_8_21_14_0_20_39_22]